MSDLPSLPKVNLAEPDTYRLIREDYYTRRVEEDLLAADDRRVAIDEVTATVDFHLSKIRSELLTQGFQRLIYGVSGAKYINDAFDYSSKDGYRFNDSSRGAWYCAFSLSTAWKEVGYHMSVELANLGIYTYNRKYRVLMAGFVGSFRDARNEQRGTGMLHPDKAVAYPIGQKLAKKLIKEGENGIVYRSVRDDEGTCLVAFHSHLVQNVRDGGQIQLIWDGIHSYTVDFI